MSNSKKYLILLGKILIYPAICILSGIPVYLFNVACGLLNISSPILRHSSILSAIFLCTVIYIVFKIRKENLFEACGFSKIGIKSVFISLLIGIVIGSCIESTFFDFTTYYSYTYIMGFIKGASIQFSWLPIIISMILNIILSTIIIIGLIFNEFKKMVSVKTTVKIICITLTAFFTISLIYLRKYFSDTDVTDVLGIYLEGIIYWAIAIFSGLLILLGAYILTKSIWSPVLIHIAATSMVFTRRLVLSQYEINGNSIGYISIKLGLAIIILLICIVYMRKSKKLEISECI